jgi:hypothetical protein
MTPSDAEIGALVRANARTVREALVDGGAELERQVKRAEDLLLVADAEGREELAEFVSSGRQRLKALSEITLLIWKL